jgi:SSS family solute:Na+ symporter
MSSIGMYVWEKVDPGMVKYVALSSQAQDQAQNMFRALWCWLICVAVTVVVSLLTKPKPDAELAGLVYGLTPIPREEKGSIFHSPVFWGAILAIAFVIVNIIFW